MKLQILIGITVIYLLFALLYHHRSKTLTFQIIIEYILIAALTLIILQSLLV